MSDLSEKLRPLVNAWTKAINSTDRHSKRCRPCNRRVMDVGVMKATGVYATMEPYRLCKVAKALHEAEVKARMGYLAAGGELPVSR